MLRKIIQFFTLPSYVKIRGRSFKNLKPVEVASMIDAHLNGDNSDFLEPALDEFLLMEYNDRFLEGIRERISNIARRHKDDDAPYGLGTAGGIRELKALQFELLSEGRK